MNHTQPGQRLPYAIVLAVAFVCEGCTGEAAAEAPQLSMATLGLRESSFADAVPTEYQSGIYRTDRPARALFDSLRSASSGSATAEIDATNDRVFFPMPRVTRTFPTQSDLAEFLIEHFGADEKFYDKDTGALIGARGSYAQHGASFFEDEGVGTRFRVSDPVLAYTAGTTGVVEVAGELLCLDPDGDCSGAHASYLEPEVVTTGLPTHVDLCGSTNVCVQFHSFFNTAPFPPWARHGSNVRFTTFSALPTSRLSTSGAIHVPEKDVWDGWDVWPMPNASNTGQNSVETAVWCFGSWDCVEHRARAVCGSGSVSDPDVRGTRRTGNGHDNEIRCF